MKKKLGKIVSWTVISGLILLALIIGIIFIQTKVNPDKIPTVLGYKPFVVLSGSMETEIYKGDLVIVKNVNPSSLKKNDIIAFKDKAGYVVTHRIVEVKKDNGKYQFITKGDNNNKNDAGHVEENDIEGVYKFKISGAGDIVLIMQKPVTLIFVLIVIFVGGFVFIALDNNKMSASDKKELEELRKKQQEAKK